MLLPAQTQSITTITFSAENRPSFSSSSSSFSLSLLATSSYFPGFPNYQVTARPGFHRPPSRSSPGHISVVTSPFLLHNKVKLKTSRPPVFKEANRPQVVPKHLVQFLPTRALSGVLLFRSSLTSSKRDKKDTIDRNDGQFLDSCHWKMGF